MKQIWTLDGEPIYSRCYKDYCTKIRYSEEDKCYYGKIENIDDLVDFEGYDYDSCLKSFYEAVDDYEELKRIIPFGPTSSDTLYTNRAWHYISKQTLDEWKEEENKIADNSLRS